MTKPLTPYEMNDRQFLGWNEQVRNQLVLDLFTRKRKLNPPFFITAQNFMNFFRFKQAEFNNL